MGVVQHHFIRSRIIILDFLIFNLRLLQLRDVQLCFHAFIMDTIDLEMDCCDRQIQKIVQGLYIMREINESKIEQQYM
jgi:hypothetical protein